MLQHPSPHLGQDELPVGTGPGTAGQGGGGQHGWQQVQEEQHDRGALCGTEAQGLCLGVLPACQARLPAALPPGQGGIETYLTLTQTSARREYYLRAVKALRRLECEDCKDSVVWGGMVPGQGDVGGAAAGSGCVGLGRPSCGQGAAGKVSLRWWGWWGHPG